MHERKNKIFRVGNRKFDYMSPDVLHVIDHDVTRAHATGIQWMNKIFKVRRIFIGETDGAGINTRYRITEECQSAKMGLGVPPLRKLHKMPMAQSHTSSSELLNGRRHRLIIDTD
jgi:hypothetical protein